MPLPWFDDASRAVPPARPQTPPVPSPAAADAAPSPPTPSPATEPQAAPEPRAPATPDPRPGPSDPAADAASDPRRAAHHLSQELRRALLRELLAEYQNLNATFFKRKLKPAGIELSAASTRLGRWVPAIRTIEIQEQLVLTRPWGVVVEVLKHEMAHQYVHEVLGVQAETSHGPAFREVCEKLGIDAAAAGMPQAAAVGDPEAIKVFERIAKLLALAESPNQNEAQAAMAAAQRLMLKHNIDSVSARAERGYTFRHLGEPTGRVTEAERLVSAILGSHFFVETIWVPAYRPHDAKWGSVLEVCGAPPNVEMAAYVHDFLHHTAAQLWRDHKRAARITGDRDRRTFLAGVMAGFHEKLQAEKKKNQEQGLVWVRDADLEGFYRKRHPRIQHVRHRGSRRTEAHAHGREAGRNIELHRPLEGGKTAGPRLLGR
jgi:predicted SprT family Zn-dependent metalloprotease